MGSLMEEAVEGLMGEGLGGTSNRGRQWESKGRQGFDSGCSEWVRWGRSGGSDRGDSRNLRWQAT